MPRQYARVRVSIWQDLDFRRLSDPAQALYFRLLTSPSMNLCGVADWRPVRMAALTNGITADDVRQAEKELAEAGYVIADDETEEILVRTFVRYDGAIKTPNIATAMVKDYGGIASAYLMGVIVHELQRLREDEPELAGWSAIRELLSKPSIIPSEMPSGKASGEASGTPSPSASGKASPILKPLTNNQQPTTPTVSVGEESGPVRDDVARLCSQLADRVEANVGRRPSVTDSWRTAARLLVDRDGRTEAQVAWMIDWATADEFWRSNILSMPTLRKQFDKLLLRARPDLVAVAHDPADFAPDDWRGPA